jgi:hypothetical protein
MWAFAASESIPRRRPGRLSVHTMSRPAQRVARLALEVRDVVEGVDVDLVAPLGGDERCNPFGLARLPLTASDLRVAGKDLLAYHGAEHRERDLLWSLGGDRLAGRCDDGGDLGRSLPGLDQRIAEDCSLARARAEAFDGQAYVLTFVPTEPEEASAGCGKAAISCAADVACWSIAFLSTSREAEP